MHSRRPNPLFLLSNETSRSSSLLSPRLNTNGILHSRSPPPSPSLPSLIPRHGKKVSSSSSISWRRQFRFLLVLCALVGFTWAALKAAYTLRYRNMGRGYGTGVTEGNYEIIEDTALPKEPSAVIVTDKKGRNRWTVHIPKSFGFPLQPEHYREICTQSLEASHYLGGGYRAEGKSYYYKDPLFIDVQEAEAQELLPQSGQSSSEGAGAKVCERSLTYVLETSDAGMGNSLLGLWLAYGLAQKEKRAFFIDDSRWPYGKFSTYFNMPNLNELRPNGCLPPPESHILPCPQQARHLMVSAETTKYTFGAVFEAEYSHAGTSGQKAIFDMARAGYEAFFRLAETEDAQYADHRTLELQEKVQKGGGMVIGLHIRRGDRHPWEYQYSKDYLPLDRYWDTARDVLTDRFEPSPTSSKVSGSHKEANAKGMNPMMAEMSSVIILASDDPDIYSHPEMARAERAQSRIQLASKSALEAASGGKKNKYIDEISGWEGGFFSSLFWSLGQKLRATDMPQYKPHGSQTDSKGRPAAKQEDISQQALQLRQLVGRAYLLDLAVLSKSDAVVCSVSSTACRLLAVMMGWDKAMKQGWWRNVDKGANGWMGLEY